MPSATRYHSPTPTEVNLSGWTYFLGGGFAQSGVANQMEDPLDLIIDLDETITLEDLESGVVDECDEEEETECEVDA